MAVTTLSNQKINPINRTFAETFDKIYKRVATQEKTCKLILKSDTFEGKEYAPDEFFSFIAPYFDKPHEFYKPFADVDSLKVRSGVHPQQSNWKPYKQSAKAMLFDTPLSSNYDVNNLVPFRWFTDEQTKADSMIIFVPGWGRESQSIEETMCKQLQTLGVDAALVTKPYHQARTPTNSKSGEYFISANMFWTIRNFQQLVAELQLLIQYFRRHYRYVGLFGMSSGGFQAGLASNCEEVDFLFSFMTGCNLWDITWDGMITNHIKSDFIANGISKEEVRKVWSICDEGVLGHNSRAHFRKHYITLYDKVIRAEHQYKLWEALGKHDKMELQAAHYSGAFVAKRVINDVASIVSSYNP